MDEKKLLFFGKILIGMLFAAWLYIWTRHVSKNEKTELKTDDKFTKFQNDMASLGIKVDKNLFRVKEMIHVGQEQTKSEIISAIEVSGQHLGRQLETLTTNFTEYQRKNDSKMAVIQTEITHLKAIK